MAISEQAPKHELEGKKSPLNEKIEVAIRRLESQKAASEQTRKHKVAHRIGKFMFGRHEGADQVGSEEWVESSTPLKILEMATELIKQSEEQHGKKEDTRGVVFTMPDGDGAERTLSVGLGEDGSLVVASQKLVNGKGYECNGMAITTDGLKTLESPYVVGVLGVAPETQMVEPDHDTLRQLQSEVHSFTSGSIHRGELESKPHNGQREW